MTTLAQTQPRTFDPAPWIACLGAAMAAGAVGGVLARLMMRVVVLIDGGQPAYSLEGTLGIVIVSALACALIAIPFAVLYAYVHWSMVWKATVLSAVLLALALFPLYAIATGDLPNATPQLIAALILLFVWIPPFVGIATAYGARWVEPRIRAQVGLMPVWPTLALAAAWVFACVNLLAQAIANTRHPVLVWTMVSASRVDFAGARDDARTYGIVIALAWCVLATAAVLRNLHTWARRRDALLLFATGGLLLASGARLPALLRWLPDTPWMLGLVQGAGLAALLALALTARESTSTLPVRVTVAIVGASVSAWLILGQPDIDGRTQWIALALLALAFVLITASRLLARPPRSTVTTVLIALFALLWLLLWAAILRNSGLRLPGMTAFAVTLSVPLFWFPWLFLPIAVFAGARQR